MGQPTPRAFTIIETCAAVAALGVAGAALTVVQPAASTDAKVQKDGLQTKSLVQCVHVWAQYTDGVYPLPSAIDRANDTVQIEGRGKDTTDAIYSLLVFNAFAPPELLVSPLEPSGRIEPDEDYEIDEPTSAVDPARALWDPGFNVDWRGDEPGNASYAHQSVADIKLKRWRNNNDAAQPVFSFRGPELLLNTGAQEPTIEIAYPQSNTLGLISSPDGHNAKAWSGNLAFNDAHVELAMNWYAHGQPLIEGKNPRVGDTTKPNKYRHDVVFLEEGQEDAFLGIFPRVDLKRARFIAIWD